MRKTLVNALLSISAKDPELMVVTADLGYSVFEPFIAARPKNYLNVGIAEQNMVGVCAGLALSGKRPIAYSITPFITLRVLEQIKLDVCYHNLPVILIGSGAGLCYGSLGPTHHGSDDLAHMRAIPNMNVIAPADPVELGQLFEQAYGLGKPLYMRIGRSTEPAVHSPDNPPKIKFGESTLVKDFGSDFALLACGNMVWVGLQALERLNSKGIKGRLYSVHTIKPIDSKLLDRLGGNIPVITLEEHTIVGGLGTSVAEYFMDNGIRPAKFKRIAIPDVFQKKVGSHEFLRKLNGISIDGVESAIEKICKD